MKKELKLYVWEDVFCDWTCGLLVVMAYSLKDARKIAKNKLPFDSQWVQIQKQKPVMRKSPCCFYVIGGG